MIHVLLVEDDRDLNQAVCKYLTQNQYQVTGCLNASEAYELFCASHYDIILSDIMMPGIDGYELAETVRQSDKNIPILFITARDDFISKQKGYRLGIDDYMVKPLDLRELPLKIEALLRRAHIMNERKLTVGGLILDSEDMSATLDGVPVLLTLREFQILFKLLSTPRHTFTRSQLLDEFNGPENEAGLRTVDVHITNLRAKLADCHAFQLVTVRGVGYKAVLA